MQSCGYKMIPCSNGYRLAINLTKNYINSRNTRPKIDRAMFYSIHSVATSGRFLYQRCFVYSRSAVRLSISRMGTINCKEFATSSTTHEQQNGNLIRGSFDCHGDYVDQIVCKEEDIADNEMKQLELGDAGKILLIKQKGVYSAVGNKCTHYGALLHTGTLGQGRIRCPWHGACFNISNGDIEDFPGLDSLPCHKVIVENGNIRVRAKKSTLESTKRLKDMVKRDTNNDKTFVVIGGGPSGGVCVETLRQECFTGRIVLICKENSVPYDRIKLSKAMDIDIDKIQFRNSEFYNEYGIETMLDVSATALNTELKQVTCSNGYSIKYDKLFIATGATPAKPNIPGVNLKNVFTLRDHEDSSAISKLLHSESELVCLGSSFISLEAAAYAANKVKKVTVIGRDNAPLKASFGEQIGLRVLQMFRDNGVEMITDSGITEFIGNDNGEVEAVILKDGSKILCNICVLGTGSKLNTAFLKNSGIEINPNGSIDTDMHLRTNVPDVYVGGDIANAPVYLLGNNRANIGHYQLAQYHGRMAAINMVGRNQDIRCIPFFWTVLFGKSFRYSGYGTPHEIEIEGSLADLKFVAIYYDAHGNVIGMASCMRDPVVSQFAELQNQGWRLHKNDIKKDPYGWTKLLNC